MCNRPEVQALDNNVVSLKGRLQLTAAERLVWCLVPKVGTTYIKYQLKWEIDAWQKLSSKTSDVKFSEHHRKSFVFIREPYSRLLSAYMDKILTTPTWWPRKGAQIMKLAGTIQNDTAWFTKCAVHATFADFIRYFIVSEKTGKGRDLHFIPMHDQCGLCNKRYDFLGHLETFSEDLDFILRSVNISVEIKPQQETIMQRKAVEALDEGKIQINKCTDNYTVMKHLWFSFQARGFLPDSLEMPLGVEASLNMTGDKFGKALVKSWLDNKGSFDSKHQKRNILRQMYQQIQLQDRLKLMKILEKDFLMFKYDPQPPEVFPEFSSV